MKLQGKVTATVLLVSFVTTAMVGGAAYWMVMREFTASIQEHAFLHFQADMTGYINTYGSYEAARKAEPFTMYVMRSNPGRKPPEDGEGFHLLRKDNPPFRFLLTDQAGRVLEPVGEYRAGDTITKSVLDQGIALEVGGRTVGIAIPVGEGVLSDSDRMYLKAVRHSLITSIFLAGPFALLIGLVLGRRIASPLRELTNTIRSMHADGDLRREVPVRSSDEIGMLAESFNTMTDELALVHEELRDSSARIQEQALEMKELSIRDHLTGLYNRRYFDEQAEKVYSNMVRYEHPLSVMICDLDHFKKVNDKYSHALGDEVLKRFAVIVAENTRAADIAARYGGEEFVVLFPETEGADALVSCEKLRRSVEEYDWDELQDGLRVTISIGLTDNIALGSVEKMLKEADERLHRAKEGGRNRLVSV